MEAIASRPVHWVINRRRLVSMTVIVLAVGITGVMSFLFHRTIRPDMLATGFVCAVVIDRVVARITRHYRRKLAEAHATLERRVSERTAALEESNRALRDAAMLQAQLRDELMVADRMATAGTLAAGVSHEIRSPLGVIRIATDEVIDQMGADADPALRELVTDISDAADRITVILRDLSSLAKPVDDPIGEVDLRGVIDSAARLASYKLGRNATLEKLPLDVPPVMGNASRLVQLILNLLTNAARASRPDARNAITIGASLRGEHVVIEIADTGTGMSAETKARLFEPFFTTGAHRGGTGLGLTICRAIVERMGGTIHLESTLGEGTTVEVALRRA
ncbi:MAG TPA: HAMP domain-containing sensor histidine kinase [Kofleriaceae bacterium]